jgi:D-tyrosyl-tRNA(Tyr) deacylase
MAEKLYEYIIEECKKSVPKVESGSFGADMKVSLLNDGPFTIVLDSADLL